ncbi:MAG: hypothetical protein L3J74_17440, partial [Bacteroidales bacterium]|nr:hypothetical protein [Bacteroidales bacterium]
MKTLRILGGILFVLLIISGCNDWKKPGNEIVKSMDDLIVSNNFNWKTTKTIPVNIVTPIDESNQLIRIYSIDNQNLLYTGYANTGSGIITAKVTVPTSYNMVKLVYGSGNRYKPVLVGIGNELYYNYNNFKEAAVTDCDLSGFITFSQGGWSSKPHGNNPGTILEAHFEKTFPKGLVIGFPQHKTITLKNA